MLLERYTKLANIQLLQPRKSKGENIIFQKSGIQKGDIITDLINLK